MILPTLVLAIFGAAQLLAGILLLSCLIGLLTMAWFVMFTRWPRP